MDKDWFVKLILLVVSLLFSALFSGSEVSLFSLNKKRGEFFEDSKGLIKTYILSLLDSPRRLLVTILLGNTIFNVGASILSVSIALDFAKANGISVDLILLVQIVILTILILIFGEITPKIWASKYPAKFAKIAAFPLYWISVILYPVAKTITDITRATVSKVKYDKSKTALYSNELKDLADLGVETGTLEKNEHDLIDGLVSFGNIVVREVMTPRVDITALPADANLEEALKVITESGHSRIPVFEESLDDIVGILYAKDLLQFIDTEQPHRRISLKKLSRKAYFIPETKRISDLMHEFQQKNIHVGIVVDEYGGTSGLISLEDIIEEIVGEIRDEYDKEEIEIKQIEKNKYFAVGKIDIGELNETVGTNLEADSDDFDTLGGFILNFAGEIPSAGYSFVKDGFRYTVEEVKNKRINKVIIEKLETQ